MEIEIRKRERGKANGNIIKSLQDGMDPEIVAATFGALCRCCRASSSTKTFDKNFVTQDAIAT